jgi:hypothetical protein
MLSAAIGKVVAVDGSDDDVTQSELRHRIRDLLRFLRIERRRKARLHVAEGAGPRARVAHDHHGRVLLGPALADIRTARFLAYRHEPVLANDLFRFGVNGRARRLDANPVRLAQDGRVGPLCLFGVPGL